MTERNGTPAPRTSSRSSAARVPSQGSERAKGVIHQAAEVLERQYDVTDMVAFEMLVRGAADAGTSVRDLAYAVLEGHPSPVDRMSPQFVDALTRQSVSR